MFRDSSPLFHASVLLTICLGLTVAAFGQQGQSDEATTPEGLAEQYVTQFCRYKLLEKELQLKNEALEQLQPAALSRVRFAEENKLADLDTVTAKELASLLSTKLAVLAEQVENHATKEQQATIKQVKKDWLAVRKKRNRWDVEQVELATAATMQTNKWLALIGKGSRWFWVCGAIALIAVSFVSWHERRHESRRWLNGARARAYKLTGLLQLLAIAAVLIALVAFFLGEWIIGMVAAGSANGDLRTEAKMNEELKRYETKDLESKLLAVKARYEEKRKNWTQGESDADLRQQWSLAEQHARQSLMNVTLLKSIVAEMEEDVNLVKSLKNRRLAEKSDIADLQWYQWLVTGGVGSGLTTATVLLVIGVVGRIKRRERKTKNTCPMCLGLNTLELDSVGQDDGGISSAIPMLRCNNEIESERCTFEFQPFYQEMEKVIFPTLGIPQAGKTLWLTMVYRELNRGRYKGNIQFEKVESNSSDQFDALVQRIINSRMDPDATQSAQLPHPLVFNFCDNDRWGRSNLLVNVFDYSGEVALSQSLQDMQRRRALRADGYLFFLDPTAGTEPQEDALNKFRHDLRVLGKVKANRALQAPVALCVSKLDLLKGNPRADPSFVDEFYDQLNMIDPTGQSMSEEVILARSELTKKLGAAVWPGWEIERLIDDLFGGRIMFFPLTPVGLDNPDGLEQGVADRVLDPFGIVEPLTWLLHMNGYPVLDKN